MTTCLLCPAVAVQDALCVPCGAKLWAALEVSKRKAEKTPNGIKLGEWYRARTAAMEALWEGCDEEPNYSMASDFLVLLEAAKAKRLADQRACAGCDRIVPRDEHKENCGRKT